MDGGRREVQNVLSTHESMYYTMVISTTVKENLQTLNLQSYYHYDNDDVVLNVKDHSRLYPYHVH